MTTNDGGPAFPQHLAVDPHNPQAPFKAPAEPGMTLLDWFAGQALGAIIAEYHTDLRSDGESVELTNSDHAIEIAHEAYAMAEAMLAARNEPNT